jgi:hypothetical protein
MQLEGFTRSARHAVIFELGKRLSACGASILDHQHFSNRVLRLSIEVSCSLLNELIAAIEQAGVSLFDRPGTDGASENDLGARPVTGTLTIRFVSDDPDLPIPVPPIPG